MADIKLNRSVRLVSLDTHPARSSLVVTYEILVVVMDQRTGGELTRRAKRDQFQINVSALDELGNRNKVNGDTKSVTLDLRQLSEDIVRNCPVIRDSGESQALEDIQLYLLYLFNRKQAQMLQSRMERTIPAVRPESSSKSSSVAATTRLRSATPSSRLPSGRRSSAGSQLPTGRGETTASLYDMFHETELKSCTTQNWSRVESEDRLDEFLEHFDERLCESERQLFRADDHFPPTGSIEGQLEGLYGELADKQLAVAAIRGHVRDDRKLASMAENRLLICALLRQLREPSLRESILYCVVRLTQFGDVYERMFGGAQEPSVRGAEGEPIDLVKVAIDALEEETTSALKQSELRPAIQAFYRLNSLLVTLNNLARLESCAGPTSGHSGSAPLKRRLVKTHGRRLALVVTGLYSLLATLVVADIRHQAAHKYERLTVTLAQLAELSFRLSVYKDFVVDLRRKSRLLASSLVGILNALQMCRPGSAGDQLVSLDQGLLVEVYGLELQLMRLVHRLLFDPRLRARLLRLNLLLKCVLRNLVLFLASSSGRSNSLAPFDQSAVLLVPFACLHELTCGQSIKTELFKSKLIIKCLLEYLLSSTSDLRTLVDSLRAHTNVGDRMGRTGAKAVAPAAAAAQEEQILLKPSRAAHYILAIWCNLSADRRAPFYSGKLIDGELRESLTDYIDLAASSLQQFCEHLTSATNMAESRNSAEAQLELYLHTKVLRNMSQFFELFHEEPIVWVDLYRRWTERMAAALEPLLERAHRLALAMPTAVECLATVANLMHSSVAFWQLSLDSHKSPVVFSADWPPQLKPVVERLLGRELQLAAQSLDGDQDDLLLVAINLLGTLARNHEICDQLLQEPLGQQAVAIISLLLESKTSDAEMLVSCLFTLSQLMRHAAFLELMSGALEAGAELEPDSQTPVLLAARALVDQLTVLMMHEDPALCKLANAILNQLKQFEEQQSLSDSFTGRRRFETYNSKWLGAIRSQADEPQSPVGAGDDELQYDRRQSASAVDLDDFEQLQAVADPSRASGLSTSNSSDRSTTALTTESGGRATVLRSTDELLDDNNYSDNYELQADEDADEEQNRDDQREVEEEDEEDEEEEEEEEDDEDDEDDDEEEAFSEPDLNVIDDNSMIKHLTSRREFRSELLRRK